MNIISANKPEHHKLLSKLGRTNKYTEYYDGHFFSHDKAYENGWIRIAIIEGQIVGLSCVRHKVRTPETMVYYIVVHPDFQGRGIGTALLADLEARSPHARIVLKTMKSNTQAFDFYKKHGYKVESENEYKGEGYLMAKELWRGFE